MLTTHVCIVLDRSGSMDSIRGKTVDAFNRTVQAVRDSASREGQRTTITFVTFANSAHVEYEGADPGLLVPLTKSDYVPDGMTAMLDGVGLGITRLQALPQDKDTSFLLICITDGVENISSRFTARSLVSLITEVQKTDRWSLAFQVPPGRAEALVRNFGIPSDNVREWEATDEGVEQASLANVSAVSNYFACRSAGMKNVKTFYKVTADLSGVDHDQLKKTLKDLSGRYKAYQVDKEEDVKSFFERKVGRPFVLGALFYQVTKREVVQPSKELLIVEIGQRKVWGGKEARKLIGLPEGENAKLTPGNLSNYRVFCKSTSVNRKLVRGTTVYVDLNKTTDDEPTWEAKIKCDNP